MKKTVIVLFCALALSLTIVAFSPNGIYTGSKGSVAFKSDAPLELIQASSNELSGALNTDDRSFLFKIKMTSFQGFNSPLQRTHFNENYVESQKYPEARFDGKIVEEIDFTKSGTHQVRAKGKMTVHGVEQNTTIRATITIGANKISINSNFTVLLEDYNIAIPSVVSQKIAQEINVEMKIDLTPKQ